MQFQSYKIADLIPASYNPRKKLKPGDKEYEKIKNSIKEFGYVEPIIINSDMTIIGGHQRATVLSDLGYTEVECIMVDIDKTKEKALNVALIRSRANGIRNFWQILSRTLRIPILMSVSRVLNRRR